MFEAPSPKDLERMCLNLPIFPLPRFSLFPYTLTHLHVFEPRYVQLVESTLLSKQRNNWWFCLNSSVSSGGLKSFARTVL